MTMDGGLERLVRILHDFCICPPPPENPNFIYGLSPPNSRPPKLTPTLNPPSFDKHAAYRFSLAFQCVVNIGVRGSEPIRSRVVQAGSLDVVGCILEAWLANKGFAVGPSSSASGLPRESREQRIARRQALAEQRQREGTPAAAELTRALQRQIVAEEIIRQNRGVDTTETSVDEDPSTTEISIDPLSDIVIATEASSEPISVSVMSTNRPPYARRSLSRRTGLDATIDASTTVGASSQTGTNIAGTRERSGTIVPRPVWENNWVTNTTLRPRQNRTRGTTTTSPDESTDNSRPETETEDDGDADVDMDQSQDTDDATSDSHPIIPRAPRAPTRSMTQRPRRTVGIISDAPPAAPLEVNADAHIIINHAQGGVVDGDGVGVVSVEDGIVSLEPNDDFAMGAPPGAPGAMDETRTLRGVDPPALERHGRTAPDVTPRATVMALPQAPATANATGNGRGGGPTPTRGDHTLNAPPTAMGRATSHAHHHRDMDSGPYKDEDVLLALQLLAYLSKYPHVRQAFYKQRTSFHPATAAMASARSGEQPVAGPSNGRNTGNQPGKEGNGLFRVFASATSRGKEREKAPPTATPTLRMTNVFSLVERFTFRPSSSESDLPNPPPKLPPEIQYWAGVIMRNACRKDDSRGGIRQCANMLCGRWETYPREFAKCRRCRKAKYCGKECQSTAWSEGHRFWCSAKEGEETEDLTLSEHNQGRGPGVDDPTHDVVTPARLERERMRPERERAARERNTVISLYPPGPPVQPPPVTSQVIRQRAAALPPTAGPPSPNTYMQMQRRRRAETVSGATTVIGMTQNGRPVYRHEVPWLADGRGRDVNEGGNNAAAQRHARMDNMIWDSSPQGDNDMVLG